MSEEKTNRIALEKTIQTIISALVDLLSSQGMSSKRFIQLAQIAYVKELDNQGNALQKIVHESGLSRRKVREILNEPLPAEQFNGLDSLLENWRKNPNFPMQLPLRRKTYPCWADLCEKYRSELTPRYILDYLLKAQCIKVENGVVHYLNSRMKLLDLNDETLNYIGFAVENLINTITHNLLNGKPELHERNIWCPSVDSEKEQLLLNYMAVKINEVRQEFHQFLEDNQIESNTKTKLKIGFGLSIWRRKSDYEK